MSDCSIKLEVGKKYVARDGSVHGPLSYNNDGDSRYAFCDSENTWRRDGRYYIGCTNSLDLVREYVEPGSANDPVDNPSHYASGAVECIDAIQASMSVEAFRGYCKGNVQKYVWRYEEKGGAESLRKAEWYLKRLLATFDADA